MNEIKALKFIDEFGTDMLFTGLHEKLEEDFAREWHDLSEIVRGSTEADFSDDFKQRAAIELDSIARGIIWGKKICYHPSENYLVDKDFTIEEGFYTEDWIDFMEGWQQYWWERAEEHFNASGN